MSDLVPNAPRRPMKFIHAWISLIVVAGVRRGLKQPFRGRVPVPMGTRQMIRSGNYQAPHRFAAA